VTCSGTSYTTANFWVGKLDTYFSGSIDSVRIYNRALNVAEVKGTALVQSGLVHDWKFDEGTGTSSTADSIGEVKNTYFYDPFGVALNIGGTSITWTETVAQPFKFQGAYLDSETGLYKMGERYYAPSIGRFLQPDPVGMNPIKRFAMRRWTCSTVALTHATIRRPLTNDAHTPSQIAHAPLPLRLPHTCPRRTARAPIVRKRLPHTHTERYSPVPYESAPPTRDKEMTAAHRIRHPSRVPRYPPPISDGTHRRLPFFPFSPTGDTRGSALPAPQAPLN